MFTELATALYHRSTHSEVFFVIAFSLLNAIVTTSVINISNKELLIHSNRMIVTTNGDQFLIAKSLKWESVLFSLR
jgi:uncharacterized membrane protein YhfC